MSPLPRHLVLPLLLQSLPLAAAAQAPFLTTSEGPVVGLELVVPNYAPEGIGALSGQVYLSAAVPVTPDVRLVAELPYSRFDPAGAGLDGATAFGNPYLGVQIGSGGALTGRIGGRLPMSSAGEDNSAPLELGAFGDFDRFEAFVPDAKSFGASLQVQQITSSGIVGRFVLGPDLVDVPGQSAEVYAAYGAQAGYERNGTAATVAVTGRALVTESGSLADRTVHQLTLAASHRFGHVRPTLSLRLPLDDELGALVDYAIGFGVRIGA